MIASFGSLMVGSGTCSTETLRVPCQVTAFMRGRYPACRLVNPMRVAVVRPEHDPFGVRAIGYPSRGIQARHLCQALQLVETKGAGHTHTARGPPARRPRQAWDDEASVCRLS